MKYLIILITLLFCFQAAAAEKTAELSIAGFATPTHDIERIQFKRKLTARKQDYADLQLIVRKIYLFCKFSFSPISETGAIQFKITGEPLEIEYVAGLFRSALKTDVLQNDCNTVLK